MILTYSSNFLTAAEESRPGGTPWSNVDKALASGNGVASCSLPASGESNYLRVTGLSQPPNGNNRGLHEVRFLVTRSSGSGEVHDLLLHVVVGDAPVGTSYSGWTWPITPGLNTLTVPKADLQVRGVDIRTLAEPDFGFSLVAVTDDELGAIASVDWIRIEYDLKVKRRDDYLDVMAHVMSGGLKPLATVAIPSLSSSAAVFSSPPAGTVAASLTVENQDLVIKWDGGTATVNAGGGNRYFSGNTYWLPVSRSYLQAARGIQGASGLTGTITYWGKA